MGIKTIITCDGCGAELTLKGPYHTVKDEMRDEGFRNQKVTRPDGTEGWEIKCGRCREVKG